MWSFELASNGAERANEMENNFIASINHNLTMNKTGGESQTVEKKKELKEKYLDGITADHSHLISLQQSNLKSAEERSMLSIAIQCSLFSFWRHQLHWNVVFHQQREEAELVSFSLCLSVFVKKQPREMHTDQQFSQLFELRFAAKQMGMSFAYLSICCSMEFVPLNCFEKTERASKKKEREMEKSKKEVLKCLQKGNGNPLPLLPILLSYFFFFFLL
jgi:hypothetical protein